MRDASPRLHLVRKRLTARADVARRHLRSGVAAWRATLLALREPARRQEAWREAAPLLAFAAAYLLAYVYGNALPTPAPLWPPDAVLLAALLLTPPRRWWGLLLVTFLIRMIPTFAPAAPAWLLVVNWLNDTLKALLAAVLVRRFAPRPLRFDTLRAMGTYMLCAVVAAPVLSAFVGAAGRAALGNAYWSAWRTWFLGDALASLVVAPAIVLWIEAGVPGLRTSSRLRAAEALLLCAALLVVGLLVFGRATPALGLATPLFYLPIPVLVWAAVRFGARGIASAMTVVTFFAITGVAGGAGLFTIKPPTSDVLSLQLFLITTAIPLMLLAAQIQEREATERALRESEEMYRHVVEEQTELISGYLPDTTLIFVNEANCRFSGKSREELLGTRWIDNIPETDRERVRAELQALLEHPGVATIEHASRLPDGSLRWQQFVNSTICDAEGRVVELQGIGRDITERKQAEEALQASEARYRSLVETQTELICRYRPDSTLTFVNEAYCRWYGKSADELVGSRFLDSLDEKAREHHLMHVATLLEHPHTSVNEHEFVRPDGSRGWQQWVDHPILDAEGRVVEIQSIGRDITDRKLAEQELEQLTRRLLQVQEEERQRIARDLHDGAAQSITALNLNLANLQRVLSNADAVGLDGQKVERLLTDSVTLGEETLREMRTLSYLLHPPLLDMAGLIPALQWYVQGFSERSGINVELLTPSNLGRLPAEAETALFRIVQEGLTNVHRHSGSPSARIRLMKRGQTVHLQVQDAGTGMASTASGGESRNASEGAEGIRELGVGIPGMRQRLRQLGGRLEVRSSARGTTVTAILPLDR